MRFEGLNYQSLTALVSPEPRHPKAHLWHTQSESGTFLARRLNSRAKQPYRPTELEGGFVDPLPPVSIRDRSSGRPAAGNDDGFAERLQIFLLADRLHRPQLRQQLVDQRTQPRPRRAVRE